MQTTVNSFKVSGWRDNKMYFKFYSNVANSFVDALILKGKLNIPFYCNTGSIRLEITEDYLIDVGDLQISMFNNDFLLISNT